MSTIKPKKETIADAELLSADSYAEFKANHLKECIQSVVKDISLITDERMEQIQKEIDNKKYDTYYPIKKLSDSEYEVVIFASDMSNVPGIENAIRNIDREVYCEPGWPDITTGVYPHRRSCSIRISNVCGTLSDFNFEIKLSDTKVRKKIGVITGKFKLRGPQRHVIKDAINQAESNNELVHMRFGKRFIVNHDGIQQVIKHIVTFDVMGILTIPLTKTTEV